MSVHSSPLPALSAPAPCQRGSSNPADRRGRTRPSSSLRAGPSSAPSSSVPGRGLQQALRLPALGFLGGYDAGARSDALEVRLKVRPGRYVDALILRPHHDRVAMGIRDREPRTGEVLAISQVLVEPL